MDFWDRDFKAIFDKASERLRLLAHDDLQREISGMSGSRIKRFFVKDRSSAQSVSNKQNEDALTALQILLLDDPAYAELYTDTFELLERAEAVTTEALSDAEHHLVEAQAAMDEIMARAGRLDGVAVFEDRHGNVWSENGELINDEALEGIVWSSGKPTYEDYLEHKETLENARLQIQELKEIEVDLGEARNRLEDQDKPISARDMERMQDDIQNKLKTSLSPGIGSAPNAETESTKTAVVNLPELGG